VDYSPGTLDACLSAVADGMAVSIASNRFGVPIRTIFPKMSPDAPTNKPGGQCVFSEELELQYLLIISLRVLS
jgi:hypothetical protein